MVGIVSYGTYIPKFRLKIADIASVWQKSTQDVIASLGIIEKSVPAVDEDAVTLALEAARQSLRAFDGNKINIQALLIGSESHPYAVNPTSTIVGEFLGIGRNYLASDIQFACKAGTTAMIAILGLIESKKIDMGLAIGTDCAQSKPHDSLEYASAAGSAAYLLGSKNLIAKLIDFTSYTSDTPDFWRRDGIRYPTHAGRFTGEPGYFNHIISATKSILHKTKLKPKDFEFCVFHMPNGKFPLSVAKQLGFSFKQLQTSLIVKSIGNPYSASSMLGLAAVLDEARPKSKILMVSYGSGAGADAFVWETTEEIVHSSKFLPAQVGKVRRKETVQEQINHKIYIDYTQYLKQTGKI